MIRYKIDILESLKRKGYSTYKIRQNKLLAEAVLQAIRKGKYISFDNLDKLCQLLEAQPGDLIFYQPDDTSEAGSTNN